jgi:hypothetical protein
MERSERGGRGRDRDEDDSRSSRRGRDSDDSRSSRRGRDDDDSGGRRGGRSSFAYRERDAGSVKKRAEQGGKDYDRYLKDDVDALQVADGDNVIRLIPPTWDDADHYGLDIYVHYEIGPDKGTYLCLNKMKGEKCPICEERVRAQKDGDDEYAKKLEPKKRVLVYAIDRNKEKEGLKVWAMPWMLDRDIVKVSVDKRSGEVMMIDHPEEGYDVMFEKHGKGMRTEYIGVSIDRRPSPLSNDKALDLAQETPLPDLLKFYPYEHIASIFDGGSAPASDSRSSGRNDSRGRDDDDDDRGRDSGRSSGGRRGRDDDDGRGRRGSSSKKDEDAVTWASVHAMNYDELCALVDQEKLDIDPDKSKSDDDLADWICEEMKIEEEKKTRRADPDDDDEKDDDRSSARRRLEGMRRGRD